MLYFALVRSKLGYASVAWNSVTITDSNKLERMQKILQPFATKDFFQDVEYHYKKLNLQTLHIRHRHLHSLFLINAFCGAKYCPSALETVGLRVPTRNIRNFTTSSCSFS
jgi:hypothetical protein